ncbi:hypothetical protein Bca52824_018837 [Brassica carinata]|uniref:RNase H type-1 domain-containing protein n=1 Tax=Brassica carinata TaxID=52824 RepID=A0A8X8AXW6_BRACI|nr:hypothetical protein Bca52824_018837 [Brassica carinata]
MFSVFQNLWYLLRVKNLKVGSMEKLRAWPWVLWSLWKSKNEFLFEGRRWVAEEIVERAQKDAEEWFLSQVIDKEIQLHQSRELPTVKQCWKPPPQEWLMCNIAFDWDKKRKALGGVWVVSDQRGTVLCHSRRVFAELASKDEAKLQALLWAAESMNSLHFNKIIFAGEFEDIFRAVLRPQAWPSFLFHRDEFLRNINGIAEWRVLAVRKDTNRGASFIADSVNRYGLFQSYVAAGPPSWLSELFLYESHSLFSV